MNMPTSLFWNKQIEFFEKQAAALSEQFDCDMKIGEMRYDGNYCFIDVECDNRHVVNLLRMKMINFQFHEMSRLEEILVEVSPKIIGEEVQYGYSEYKTESN